MLLCHFDQKATRNCEENLPPQLQAVEKELGNFPGSSGLLELL